MKTMTCSQLGGPDSCSHQFQAETFEEISQKSKSHGIEMGQKKDQAHLKVMEEMKKGMNDPQAMKNWMDQKRQEFDALPKDN